MSTNQLEINITIKIKINNLNKNGFVKMNLKMKILVIKYYQK